MVTKVAAAFHDDAIVLPLEQILPLRKLPATIRATEKYKCIAASLQEIGLIEPLIVFPEKQRRDQYLLLDGTIRLDILSRQGEKEVLCLIATEAEAFTYNHKVSQVSAIQEHFMIMKTIENGVSEERIAKTLNVDVAAIRRKRDLLQGLCDEAIKLLKDRRISPAALREIKRTLPLRQIEMAELMIASNNYSTSHAKSLYCATPDDQKPPAEHSASENHGLTPEEVGRLRREMANQREDYKLILETHGENTLNLTLAGGYLRTLLANTRVMRFLTQHYAEILAEFQQIVASPDLDSEGAH